MDGTFLIRLLKSQFLRDPSGGDASEQRDQLSWKHALENRAFVHDDECEVEMFALAYRYLV